MESLWNDLRFSGRMLLKRPAFTCVALLALVLGIGANTAMFSVVNAVLLRPLPFHNPDRLAVLWERSPPTGKPNVANPQNFKEWERRNRSFERMAAYIDTTVDLAGHGRPEQVHGAYVTRDFFPVLEVAPVLGRNFLQEEDVRGHGSYALISHGLWERRYGSDPGILGSKLQLSGDPVTVVGVMPASFRFPDMKAELWILHVLRTDVERKGRYLSAIARMKPGVPLAAARAEMETIGAQLAAEHPAFNRKWGATAVGMREEFSGALKTPLFILLASVALVLLISCANVANLMLIRATGRRRELALRSSLGATRARIARQLMLESALLGLLGGALGLIAAVWAKDGLLALLPESMSIAKVNAVLIDRNVLAFTLGLSLLTGLLFGVIPALKASRVEVMEILKDGARGMAGGLGRNRLRSALAAGEIAFALMLLIGAALMIKSLTRLQNVQPGFQAENVLTMRVNLKRGTDALPEILTRLRRLPGVTAAGSIMFPPMTRMFSATGFYVDGQPAPKPGDQPVCTVSIITPDYLRAMGIPLIQGRAFGVQDSADVPKVTLINRALASQFFAGENPVGHSLKVQWGNDKPYRIVGVVGDVKQRGLDEAALPTVYFPDAQEPSGGGTLVIRTAGDPMNVARMAQDAIHGFDPNQAIADIAPMTSLVSKTVARPRFQSILSGSFAGLALLLASIGVFGVMAYSVAERTSEIGVRVALGARTGTILRMVLKEGAVVSLIGIATGLLGALALTRFLRSLLFEVSPFDLGMFLAGSLLLAAVALLASFFPAMRAARIDAMEALRYE